jgi:hypothetical protein
MKYLFLISLVAFACAGFASGDQTLVHDYSFSSPSLTPVADGYTQIAIPDCSVAAQPGAPQIPFRTVKLLLPAGTSVSRITAGPLSAPVIPGESVKVDFGRTPRSPAVSFNGVDEPDSATYNSTNRFPSADAELISVQRMDGYDIAIIRLYPVRYAPVPGSLIFTPDLRVTVFLTGGTNIVFKTMSSSAATVTPGVTTSSRVADFVDNPELFPQNTSQTVLAAMDAPAGADGPSPSYDYLIVSSTALMPYFQPLIDLKVAEGLTVTTETMTNIVTNYSGSDHAEKLRNFIRYAHTNWNVQYVLLGGDIEVVPARGTYGYCNGETQTDMPSDLYYACLDGSWNSNSNSIWGEPADNVDLIAEVYVGRAPVSTPAETSNFVAKTVASQTAPSGSYNAVFAAEYFSGAYQGGDALDYIQPAFANSRCRVEWLDDRPQTVSTWDASGIIPLLNRSPLFVAHSGHADIDTVMRLGQSDVDSLTNQFPFLLYSTGCDAGYFDYFYLAPDSIGEEFIKRNLHGAFSAILNSRLGWYDSQNEWKYSGEFQAAFFTNLLRAGHSTIGKADRKSREALIGKVETSGSMPYRWCYFGLVLFGDPHAFVDVPVTLTLPSINSGATNCIIEWNSLTNNCALYRTTNLVSQTWSCVVSNLAPTPPLNTWTNTTEGLSRAFYRVIGE